MSNTTFGFVLSAYSWTYAALQLPMGVLLDRFGVRLIGCLSALLWSIASFAGGAATSVTGFVASRLLLGVGEAPTFPASLKQRGRGSPDRNEVWRRPCLTEHQNLHPPSEFRSSAWC